MVDFIGLLVLLLLTLLFGYLAFRAWRSRRGVLKWIGLVLSALLTLILALVFVAAVMGTLKLNQNYNASHPAATIKVAGTPEQVARGRQIANLCAGCHSPNGQPPLSGQDFGAGFPVPFGTLYARNLTPGGEIKDWTDGEVVRAIREGVHKSGRSLIIMPASAFHRLSDEDAASIVAFLRSQPPVTPDAPPNNLNVLGALLIGTLFSQAQTVQPHISAPIVAPPPGATAEYGNYLANFCRECHGENFEGRPPGPEGGGPIPALKGVVSKWTEEQFTKTIRTGTKPDGTALGEGMPWKDISASSSDTDLQALYAFLKTVQ